MSENIVLKVTHFPDRLNTSVVVFLLSVHEATESDLRRNAVLEEKRKCKFFFISNKNNELSFFIIINLCFFYQIFIKDCCRVVPWKKRDFP